jgi:hypothetical protein
MNAHYLQAVDDTLVPVELTEGPYFHTWNSSKNAYVKTKYTPVSFCEHNTDGLKVAAKLIKAISGPTYDFEAIREAKQEFATLVKSTNEL